MPDWCRINADIDRFTDATRSEIKAVNKELSGKTTAAQRAEAGRRIDAAKARWFVEFGKHLMKEKENEQQRVQSIRPLRTGAGAPVPPPLECGGSQPCVRDGRSMAAPSYRGGCT